MDTPIVVRYSFLLPSLETAAPTIEINTFNTSITQVTGERGRRGRGETDDMGKKGRGVSIGQHVVYTQHDLEVWV